MSREKSDKMRGLQSTLLLFRNKFNEFNNTGPRMLDSIYHMTLKLIKNHIFWRENDFAISYPTLKWMS